MRSTKKMVSSRVYELWFEFLKLADPAKCDDAVKNDFGDVWKTDFKPWWEDHAYLFESLDPLTFEFVNTVDDFKHFEGSDDLLVITVPLLASKMHLRKEFEKLLREYHPGERGRPKYEDYAEHYSLCSRPYVQGLEQTLKVYKYKLEHPFASGEEIEDALTLITKKGSRAGEIWKAASTPKEFEHLRNIQRSTVSRYLRQANVLIENVAQGVFPKNKNART